MSFSRPYVLFGDWSDPKTWRAKKLSYVVLVVFHHPPGQISLGLSSWHFFLIHDHRSLAQEVVAYTLVSWPTSSKTHLRSRHRAHSQDWLPGQNKHRCQLIASFEWKAVDYRKQHLLYQNKRTKNKHLAIHSANFRTPVSLQRIMFVFTCSFMPLTKHLVLFCIICFHKWTSSSAYFSH